MTPIMMRRGRRACVKNRRGDGKLSRTRSCIINSDCLMYAARIRARRRKTRSGKDITGLSRMTRRTGPSNGDNKASAFGRSACIRVRMRVRKQVRFIYRVRIGEILRRRREILSAGSAIIPDGY